MYASPDPSPTHQRRSPPDRELARRQVPPQLRLYSYDEGNDPLPSSPPFHTSFIPPAIDRADSDQHLPHTPTGRTSPIPPRVVVNTPTSQTSSASDSPTRRAAIQFEAHATNYSRPRVSHTPDKEAPVRQVSQPGYLSRTESPSLYENPRPPPSPSVDHGRSWKGSHSPGALRSPAHAHRERDFQITRGPLATPETQELTVPSTFSTPLASHVSSSTARSLSPYSSLSSAQSERPRSPRSTSPVPATLDEPYERYSYYELPSPLPSPDHLKSARPLTPEAIQAPPRVPQPTGLLTPASTRAARSAEDYLTLGINSHLHDSPSALAESARYFHTSATLNGGCGMGMLMWGLCLRHGWGVDRDEKQAFHWLRRACEIALGDLEEVESLVATDQKQKKSKSKSPPQPLQFENELRQEVKGELILAIYEVGQSFFQGWGVPRDRSMGFVSPPLCCITTNLNHGIAEIFSSGSTSR